jgi:hypothetical protein
MKKIATGALLIILVIAVQATYLNYRLEQKLAAIEQHQQNILTKVYSLERSTVQVKQNIQQALQKQYLNPRRKSSLLLTSSQQNDKINYKSKVEDIN